MAPAKQDIFVVICAFVRSSLVSGLFARFRPLALMGSANQVPFCLAGNSARDIDLALPIPRLLDYYYRNNSLLFLGCSLHNDRTIQVFRANKASHHGDGLPQHFVLEFCPENLEELRERNAFLADLGIAGIWFETKRYECVESILRLARNELAYRDTQ